MIKILEILDKEIREREERSRENFEEFILMEQEIKTLQEQIKILKKDLRELSEYAKNNNIV
jgi:peptidoglycan hydrolase CwlO-like protein